MGIPSHVCHHEIAPSLATITMLSKVLIAVIVIVVTDAKWAVGSIFLIKILELSFFIFAWPYEE